MNFKEFQSLIPRDVDIRPFLPDVVRLYTQGNEQAHKSRYGPDGYVITRAEQDCSFWKADHRTNERSKGSLGSDDSFKDYTKMVDAWKRDDKSKRGDKNRAAVVLFWFFRFVDEPVYFMTVAASIWDHHSEIFKRFAYAKLGDSGSNQSDGLMLRYNTPLGELESLYKKLNLTAYIGSGHSHTGTTLPLLVNSWKSSSKYHFSNYLTKYHDRTSELESVVEQLKSLTGFGWMQFSGPAGSGKTRLAAEIIKVLNPTWSAGFLTTRNLQKFSEEVTNWKPHKPHLIVIDYVIPRSTAVADFMQVLASSTESYEFPVAVILLERQPWNLETINSSEAQLNTTMLGKFDDKLRASWFLELHRERDAHHLSAPEFLIGDGLQKLGDFEPADAVSMVYEQAGYEAEEIIGKDQLKDFLVRNQVMDRPLYLIFVAEALKDGSFQQSWTRTDILSDVLRREERNYWQSLSGAETIFDSIRLEAVELACVFTVINGIGAVEIGKRWPKIFDFHADAVKAAVEITGSEIWENGEINLFSALEPNLLGEWFVLQELEKHRHAARIVPRCWNLDRGAVRAFLLRAMEDFPDHVSINLFFEEIPEDKDHLEFIEEIALHSFQNAVRNEGSVPIGAYFRLAKSLHSECVLASAYCRIHQVNILAKENNEKGSRNMRADNARKRPVDWFVDGFMYERGWGVEKNVARAFECYETAHAKGHPLSAICQHFALNANRMKYQLAGDTEELLEDGVKGVLAATEQLFEDSGKSGSNRLASQMKSVVEYSSSFLNDASQFFLQMAVNNQRNKKFSDQYFENAEVFLTTSRLLVDEPEGELHGNKITDLASKLMFDVAYFFDFLSHDFESQAGGNVAGMGIRSDTMGWSMMENSCVYAIFGYMLKHHPTVLTYGVPPKIWHLRNPMPD